MALESLSGDWRRDEPSMGLRMRAVCALSARRVPPDRDARESRCD